MGRETGQLVPRKKEGGENLRWLKIATVDCVSDREVAAV